jgi:multicomponent Na+:H+ antiporter subunit D
MNAIAFLIVLPLASAALCMLTRRSLARQLWISGIATHALLAMAVAMLMQTHRGDIFVTRIGGWPGTFGIIWTVDVLSAIMLTLSAILQTITWWFVRGGAMGRLQQTRHFHPLFLLLCCGVNWAFCTADLFNLFVSFELILLASYALLAHNNEGHVIRESIKFLVLNALSGTFFLAAAGLMYGAFGTLNLADLAVCARRTTQPGLLMALGTLLLAVFSIKAALFPLFFWLPDAYPKAPVAVLPYFAGMLTKVGVYCLYRIFPLIFSPQMEQWFQPLFLAIAGGTMLIGVLAALSQWTIRRVLSFHIISQIGYMIFGLGLYTPLGLAGGIFYIIHHIVVKSSLFLVAGYVVLWIGTDRLKNLGGLMNRRPAVALCFMLVAFSLAGLPPLSGFYGKYALVLVGLDEGRFFYTAISILTSLLTLASMVKIWNYTFVGKPGPAVREAEAAGAPSPGPVVFASLAALVAVSLAIAAGSGWIMELSQQAATQLLNPDWYISAVTGRVIESGVVHEAVSGSLPPGALLP